MATTNAAEGAAAAGTAQEPKQNYFLKLWSFRRYLTIEPFFFFYYMAYMLHAVAIQNFPLDKACRVNLGYNKAVCDNMLDKAVLNIDCDGFNFENTTQGPSMADALLDMHAINLNYTVCKAEVEAQILAADVSGKRAPIASIFPLIVLLFGGGWSDRYGKRKPCIMLPAMGEALSFACLLISSVFFDSVPMEFGAYCEAIVPALFGGFTLCLMAIYSYMTIATPEEDRVFRFGIFGMFISAVPLVGQPVSGYLFQLLGYTMSFIAAMAFEVIAVLYVIFFLPEIKSTPASPPLPSTQPPAASSHAADNMAYETTNVDELQQHQLQKNVNFELRPQLEAPKQVEQIAAAAPAASRSVLREIFDPTLVTDVLKFPFIKRENNGRMFLLLLLFGYLTSVGPVFGESDYWYRYALKKLNWNGNDYSLYITTTSGLAIVGTFIGTAIFSELFKFSPSTIGALAALAVVISRLFSAYASNSVGFYAGGVMDMWTTLRVISIKTISSSIIDGDDLSKMYSVFGLSEPISQAVFAPIYSEVYQNTVETFPGAIFLISEVFFVPNTLVFIACYFLLRRQNAKKKQQNVELAQSPGSNGHTNPDSEITSL